MKENVRFLNSPDFIILLDFWTENDVRQSPRVIKVLLFNLYTVSLKLKQQRSEQQILH